MSHSPLNSRRLLPLIAVMLVTATGILWLKHSESSRDLQVAVKQSSPLDTAITPNAPRLSKPTKIHRPLVKIDSDETWDMNLAGNPQSIKLALDQANFRDADGKDKIVSLTPPATQETLQARLAELNAPGGVFPVAYLTGEDRSVSSRRIVTSDLRVQMDEALADKIAAQNQLVIKDRPTYAPGWVIMSAKNAFAALDAMADLRAMQYVASADVLLATQHSLRALPNDPLVSSQWHLNPTPISPVVAGSDVNITSTWDYPSATGIRGNGIRIGVVDDGLQTAHPDLAPNVDTVNDKDWNGNDADPNPGTGDDHGTACAGNAAARGNNGIGVTGTAPEATLVGMRLIAAAVTDAQEGEAETYLPDLIQIKTNSWGPNDTGTSLDGPGPLATAALQTAATSGRGGKGSIILWAGGNGGDVSDNSNYDGYANSIYTIAIGATDSKGTRAYYSEPGSNIVVAAPSSGDDTNPKMLALGITTVDRTGADGYNVTGTSSGELADLNYTNSFGGTSSATPTAAGIVALMLQKNPNLGWRDVQEILIKTATKFKPADAGWVTNGAGIPFNHDFGAGLINATAAVNLSAAWTNLSAQTSTTSTQSGLTAAIANNNATGVTRTFDLSASNIRVEQVTLKISATHSARGNLQITLTSPSGMVSTLAAVHPDKNANYSNWTFSSVRNWGENSAGTWTLKVADLTSTNNSTGGTLTAAELKVFGSAAAPVNPAPLVQITQPTNDQIFSPGASISINANANDLTLTGSAGVVSQVQFFDNDTLLGIDTSSPYSLTFSPALGNHTLIAKATDSEGAIGNSTSVTISVANQIPVITAATLSATGQTYTTSPLTVASISASDPEGAALTYRYQWQASTNLTVFTDVPGATTSTSPSLAGNLLRCVIIASDGNLDSAPFTTAAVNLLIAPNITAATGTSYSYQSGLVLNGTDSQLSRQAIIHEFSQGPAGGSAEWIEILTLKSGSLAYWDLSDAAGHTLVFLDAPVWDNIPAGTLIVIYNGASKDPLLPADDLDPSDGRMVISSSNAGYFDPTYDKWLPLGNSGDSIFLSDDLGDPVHSVAYGNSTATTPNVGLVGSGKSAYFAGDSDAGADLATNWRVTTSTAVRTIQPRVAATLPIVFGGPWSTLTTGFTGAGMGTPYTTSLGGDTAAGSAKFDDQSDSTTIEFSAQAGAMTYRIKGNPSTGTATSGTFLAQESPNGTTYTTLRTITNATNVDTAYTDTPLAATRFIRFIYQVKSTGNIQLDKLSITGLVANALTLNVTPTTFAENIGASAATGTVSIPAALDTPLIVTLASSDTSEASLPSSVTIAAGQTSSPTFAIAAVDDLDSDGTQLVTLTASASGYTNGFITLTVTDNEPSIDGITPASANNAINQVFITALRNGSLNSPALFRVGVGSTLPAGLTLDPATGVLSGVLASNNPAGDYLIVIERYNSLGDSVSQSYTLTLGAGTGNTFALWISNFPVGSLNGFKDDPDFDGIPNGLENYLGTSPNQTSPGLTMVSTSGQALVFRHSRSNSPATDLTTTYEWSTDLATWNLSGTQVSGTTVTITTQTIVDSNAPDNDVIEVTATPTGTLKSKLFVRLKSLQ